MYDYDKVFGGYLIPTKQFDINRFLKSKGYNFSKWGCDNIYTKENYFPITVQFDDNTSRTFIEGITFHSLKNEITGEYPKPQNLGEWEIWLNFVEN